MNEHATPTTAAAPRLPRLALEQAALYQVCLQGYLQADWADWLQSALIEVQPAEGEYPAVTTLAGIIADQPALFGLLARVRDLGLPLLSVTCLGPATGAPFHSKGETS